MEFYILNQNEEVTATLSTDSTGEHTPVYSAVVDEKLGSYDTLELSIPSGVEHDLDIKEEYYIVFEDIKGFREYIINEVVDVDDGEISRTITAELSSIELLDEIIQTNLTGNNPTTILTNMLKNTRWTIGNVDPSIYNSAFTEETEMVSVLEGIDLLSSSFNAEVSFSYAVAGNKITKRFVNLHKQMGANNGKRFEVDKDVTSIKRTIDTSSIKTAIIPFGAEPEEGKARLNIKDLVWSKAAGNPVDKPKGQEWIGDPTALAQWGKNNADGSRRHRFLAQEINVETAAELATMAWVQLGQYTKPKTTYEAVAMDLYTLTGDEDLKHEYVNLGDTVVITDYYFAQPLVVQTRVSELKRDLLEPLNNDLVFGDSLELFSTSKQADRLETIKKELSNRIELVRQSADGKSDTYMGSDEPISPNEKDMWYRPHPTIPNETQFLIFNGLTWDIVLDTSNLDSVGKEVIAIIEQADRDREQAEADFESAKTAAKAYTDTKASEFDTKVEAVKTDLAATKIKADKAVSDAQTAITEAGFAKVDATTAKQNAVTAISTAETAKTNAANALTNAATAISTANTAKTNAGTALTTAQTSLTNSGTALTNAQTALDAYNNLEIGGRNLLIGTTDAKTDFNFAQNGNAYRISPNNIDTFLKGGAYTVSVEVTDWEIGTMPIGVMVSYRLLGGGAIQQFFSYSNTLVNPKTGTITNTFILPNMSTTSVGYIEVHLRTEQNVTAKGKFRKMMLSKGTKATDWTPAPEDIQVQITDINGELSRKVAQTTFDTLNGTVTNQGTQISQSQTAIGLKADKTLVDTINQTVANHTLSIKATADSLATKAEKSLVDTINQTVTKHTTDIKATSDGLALKSDKSVVDSINSTVNTHTSQIKATSDGLALKADSTLVNTVKGTVDTHTTQIKATSDGLALKAEKSLVDTINSTVGTHTTQIKATSDGLALKAEKSLVDTVKSTVNTHTTQIKATSDGLALKAESSLVNSINGTVNTHTGQISANSTAIAARLTSAQVDSLVAAKKYVNETTLNATANGLSTSITQVNTDLSNLEIGGRNLIINANTTPNKYLSNAGLLINNSGDASSFVTDFISVKTGDKLTLSMLILGVGYSRLAYYDTNKIFIKRNLTQNIKAQTIIIEQDGFIRWSPDTGDGKYKEGFKVEKGNKATGWTPAVEDMATLEKFTTLEATVNGINTVVGTKASQSQVTQLATQVSSKVESADYSTKMTQLDNSINLRVESSKLISQINVSTEGILLQGKRIQLDGDVTMTTAFVTDIKAKSLEAVYADIATLKTKVLTADVITSTMLKSDTALIAKLFSTDANIGVLTSKTAFINSVKAVDISADRITTGTLNASNVNIINMNASKINTGVLSGITITSPFDYVYEGTTRNKGTTTIANGQFSSLGTFTGSFGRTFMYINPDTIYAENMKSDGTVRSMYKLSGKGLEVNILGDTASYTQDGIYFESGGQASVKYHKGNARIEIGSYNGVGLGANANGVYQNRITVGGGNNNLGPFVDIWSPLTIREGVNMSGKEMKNATTISGIYNLLFQDTSNRIVQGSDNILNIMSPAQISMGYTNGTITSNSLVISNAGTTFQKQVQFNGNPINGANNINNAQNILFNGSSNRIVQGNDGFFNILAPIQLNLGWTDGSSTFNTMVITKNQIVARRVLNMDGNSITNQSDIRLKKNIVDAEVDGILLTEKQRFIEFEWDETNPYNTSKPEGAQFGLVAQYAGFLSVKDPESNYLSIDMNKQVNLNTLTNQQIIKRLKAAEEKIKQLESGI